MDIDITLGVGIDHHLDALLQMIKRILLRTLPEDVAAFVKQTLKDKHETSSHGTTIKYLHRKKINMIAIIDGGSFFLYHVKNLFSLWPHMA